MSYSTLFKYDSKSRNVNEFINDEEILKTISQVESGNYNIREILDKAKEMKGLEPNEALALLLCDDKSVEDEMFEIAKKIKLEIYKSRQSQHHDGTQYHQKLPHKFSINIPAAKIKDISNTTP